MIDLQKVWIRQKKKNTVYSPQPTSTSPAFKAPSIKVPGDIASVLRFKKLVWQTVSKVAGLPEGPQISSVVGPPPQLSAANPSLLAATMASLIQLLQLYSLEPGRLLSPFGAALASIVTFRLSSPTLRFLGCERIDF
jgi:hypothetical protein